MENIAARLTEVINIKCDGKSTVFAKKAGIPVATFHNYMKGRTPSAEAMFHVRETFGVNINWLLSGEGEMFDTEAVTAKTSDDDLIMDLEVLHRIIKWVEEWLDRENKSLPPDKKARFIALAYEYFTTPKEGGDGRDVNDKDMNKWLRLVV
ncbi:hypothetical protein SAMN05216233_109212 [Desulfoluna spongiiphila]|uniref:HTH cro/C1-type domain-containing protein n=2 Tax=Desulfoluna spongiiphila TaxID=419481 RepID=A0A1G5G480_9BACT|nr:hypothetical protein SAMN05216233_109212 [Desulfoluna spongiiphila]